MRDGREQADADTAGAAGVRIDKWLWAARFYKTRSMAADAVTSGKVELNGERTKPAKALKTRDMLRIRQGVFEQIIEVKALSETRGPAKVAQTLYEETAESAATRAKLAERLRYEMPPGTDTTGRPTKKERRDISRLRKR